jgi:hypothetical protein
MSCVECPNPADTHCIECESDFCGTCAPLVHKPKALSKHKLVPVKSKPPVVGTCQLHNDKMQLFCLDRACRLPICGLCASHGAHRGHHTDLLVRCFSRADAGYSCRVSACEIDKTRAPNVLRMWTCYIEQTTVEATERVAMADVVSQTAEQKDIMGQIVTSLNEAESALLTHQEAFISQLRLQLEQIKQALAARSVVLVCRHVFYFFYYYYLSQRLANLRCTSTHLPCVCVASALVWWV